MDEITSIEEMVKGVLSQPPTDYFTFNPKDGYKIVQLDKEVWFFYLHRVGKRQNL
ncbi:MAG: hypothetical protein IPL74_19455 [Bacteroidetes bacterium]|nr:hypothetical protein [Bacteroidota bacterium]